MVESVLTLYDCYQSVLRAATLGQTKGKCEDKKRCIVAQNLDTTQMRALETQISFQWIGDIDKLNLCNSTSSFANHIVRGAVTSKHLAYR